MIAVWCALIWIHNPLYLMLNHQQFMLKLVVDECGSTIENKRDLLLNESTAAKRNEKHTTCVPEGPKFLLTKFVWEAFTAHSQVELPQNCFDAKSSMDGCHHQDAGLQWCWFNECKNSDIPCGTYERISETACVNIFIHIIYFFVCVQGGAPSHKLFRPAISQAIPSA